MSQRGGPAKLGSMSRVGVVGLGNMGSAFAGSLLDAGHSVIGCDPARTGRDALERLGGQVVGDAAAVAIERVELVVLSLPGASALLAVAGCIADAAAPGLVVVDTSTIDVEDKRHARDRLAAAGVTLIDGPVSGTPESVREGRLALYGSGDEAAFRRVENTLRVFAPAISFVGAFGDAMRLKLICNMLVMIHNAATAEAMALATAAGFDRRLVHEVVASGVASSRIWELRGAMMIDGDYRPGAFGYRIAEKDGRLIVGLVDEVGARAPLFTAAQEVHRSGSEMGLEELDLASVFQVYREWSKP